MHPSPEPAPLPARTCFAFPFLFLPPILFNKPMLLMLNQENWKHWLKPALAFSKGPRHHRWWGRVRRPSQDTALGSTWLLQRSHHAGGSPLNLEIMPWRPAEAMCLPRAAEPCFSALMLRRSMLFPRITVLEQTPGASVLAAGQPWLWTGFASG